MGQHLREGFEKNSCRVHVEKSFREGVVERDSVSRRVGCPYSSPRSNRVPTPLNSRLYSILGSGSIGKDPPGP